MESNKNQGEAETLKAIPDIMSQSKISRQYMLALGSVAHYLKRIEQYHESQSTGEPLPPRWLFLAERSLTHRPILKYRDYFSAAEYLHPNYEQETVTVLQKLDDLVESINSLLQQPGILQSLKKNASPEFESLNKLYSRVRAIVNGGLEE